MVQQAPRHVSGIEFAGEFHDYITADRRARFPPGVSSAAGCVAFIDFDKDSGQAMETAEALRNLPSLKIVAVGVSSQLDADLLLRAMRAGCSEFLQKPLEAAAFEETLRRLESRFRSTLAPSSGGGQVISLFGAKGGVGVTTLAVHLAAYLVKRHGKRTLLIDHHRQLGHVGLHLGLKESQYHFDELLRNAERLDADLLKGFVVQHDSGLNVVTSSDTCCVPYSSTTEEIGQVLQFLRHAYDCIVIDSSLEYGEITAATIQFSDEVYLVVTPDVAALRDLARHVQHLNLSGDPAKKPRIVVNRAATGDAIGPEQVEQAVGFPVSINIPNNYAELMRAINAGEPIPPQRNAGFTAQMKKWAARICDGDAAAVEAGAVMKSKFAFWR
jgi:pilus assembly protein CpaE